MTDISYYEINVDFSTGKLMSVEANNTDVTLSLPESLDFNYTITIVVHDSEGMSSEPASKSFGMKIHTQLCNSMCTYVIGY